jgi:hypothetical protein
VLLSGHRVADTKVSDVELPRRQAKTSLKHGCNVMRLWKCVAFLARPDNDDDEDDDEDPSTKEAPNLATPTKAWPGYACSPAGHSRALPQHLQAALVGSQPAPATPSPRPRAMFRPVLLLLLRRVYRGLPVQSGVTMCAASA